MTIKQKAVSIGASAALLGSLLASTVAGTAFAAATMSPTTGPQTGGTLVSISGASGFTTGATGTTVTVCGVAAPVTSVSPDGTALTFTTPDVSSYGYVGLCGVATSNPATPGLPGFYYTITAPGPVTMTPASGTVKGGTVVTLSAPGQGPLANGTTTVTVCGVNATGITVTNSTTVIFVTPAGAATGACAVNVDDSSVTYDAVVGEPAFTYTSAAAAFTMVPTSGPTGTVVQLSSDPGTFDLGCQVAGASTTGGAGSIATAPTAVAADGSKLTFVIPSGTAADKYKITVSGCVNTATNGGSGGNFTVTGSASGTAVTPATVDVDGGTVVQVTGTGFNTATQIYLSSGSTVATACFGPINPTSVAAAGTSLTFVMPAKSDLTGCTLTNNVAYVWTTPLGTTAAGSVTYTTPAAPPSVTAVSPTSGSRAGGNTVTITGTGFQSGAKVGFGSTQATSVTFVSATQLTVVAPSGVGTVPVTVQNPDGQSGQLPNAYTYTETGYVCGAGTALGSTKTGPFGTATVVAKVGQYITWKISCGTAASGQIITVLKATKNSAGVWSSFTPYTSRVADSGGNIYVWYKASSPAWWSMRGQIASVLSPARQGRWQ